MSNEQWGHPDQRNHEQGNREQRHPDQSSSTQDSSHQGLSQWAPAPTSDDDTQLRPLGGEQRNRDQQAAGGQSTHGQPQASAAPPASQASAWEDTGWLPGSWQSGAPAGQAASANPPSSAASAAGRPEAGSQYPTSQQSGQYGSGQYGSGQYESGQTGSGQAGSGQAGSGQYPSSQYPTPQQSSHQGWDQPTQPWGQPQNQQFPAQQYQQSGAWQGGTEGSAAPAPSSSHKWGTAPKGDDAKGVGGFFRSLFDVSFQSYVTPALVKIVYILVIIGSVGGWLLFTLMGFGAGAAMGGDGSSALGVIGLLFGWIPAILNIALTRIALEFMIAAIRTSEHARDIKDELTQSTEGND